MLIILAAVAGALLGLSFNVAIVLPVTLAGAVAYGILASARGLDALALPIVLNAVALQAGYVIGLTGRDLLAQILIRLKIAQSKRV
jgi:hypothetical protein